VYISAKYSERIGIGLWVWMAVFNLLSVVSAILHAKWSHNFDRPTQNLCN